MKRLILLIIFLAIATSMMMTSCFKQTMSTQTNSTPPNLPDGLVTTLAGPSFQITSGTGTAASFNAPKGIAVVDASGNIYVADELNNLIRKISSSGIVSTLAGSGTQGSANGTGTAASFNQPTGVAVDALGDVYVADHGNNMIRMIDTYGSVSTLAGDSSGASGSANGTAASFNQPSGVAVDAAGNVYVADLGNKLIREISTTYPSYGVVTTLAGAASIGSSNNAATFNEPTGVAVDAVGNVYVADAGNNLIQKVSQSGEVSTLAGSGIKGSANGAGTTASFANPTGVAVDAAGNVYVADANNDMIRMISSSGVVSTLAGSGINGSSNGSGASASFLVPSGVAVDAAGNVYVADKGNNLIRKISPSAVVTTLAGNGTSGSANSTASFNKPTGVAVDASGNVYVADQGNRVIRTISPAGVVSTLAGSGAQGSVNDTGTAASFNLPAGVAVDAAGDVYVADAGANLIRKINRSGIVTTLAGSGAPGSANGAGTTASFNSPWGVAVDAAGNVYVADQSNNLIRMISPSGVVTTLAGSGKPGSANGTGTLASFYQPAGVAVDASGNVYVADAVDNLIRKISPSGVVSTWAGSGTQGSINGTGTAASFNNPSGVAVDTAGNVYVADYENNLIRMISSSGVVSTWAGNGSAGSANGRGLAASFDGPFGIAVNAAGKVYVADAGNNLIRMVSQ